MRAPLLSRTLYFVPKVSRIVSQLAAKTHQIQSLGQLFNFLGGGGGHAPRRTWFTCYIVYIHYYVTIMSLVGCN